MGQSYNKANSYNMLYNLFARLQPDLLTQSYHASDETTGLLLDDMSALLPQKELSWIPHMPLHIAFTGTQESTIQ